MISKCFWILLVYVYSELIESFTGVWELSNTDIEEALNTQPNLLIEFYSPKCGHCKEFTPHYNGLGEHMYQNESCHIARIDVEQFPQVMSKYGIDSIPTMIFFRNKVEFMFTGMRSAIEVYRWLTRLQNQTFHVFQKYSDFSKASLGNTTLIYFGDLHHKNRKGFDELFEKDTSMEYGVILSLKDSELKKSSPGVILKQGTREKTFKLTETQSDLHSFIQLNKGYKVREWSEATKDLILNKKVQSLIFFFSENSKEEFLPIIEEIAEKFYEDILITYADMQDNSTEYVQKYFGLTSDYQPLAAIIDSRQEYGKFVLFDFKNNNVEDFVNKWKKHELKSFYKSQLNVEKEVERGVRVLTGNNFEELVYNESVNYVVYFYNLENPDCAKSLVMFERAAYELRKIPDLEFGKIVIDLNEVNGVKIKSMPAIKLFPKNDKQGLHYEGHMGKFNLFKFLRDFLDI